MAMNFKLLFQQTGKLVLFYVMELRGWYWNLPSHADKTFSIKVLPGHKIKFARKGDIAEIIFKNEVLVDRKKSFEYSTLQLFTTILQPGDVILDVGANAGLYSVFYSRLVGENGHVHAFEPDVNTYGLLRENLQLNNCNNVSTYNFALSNKASRVEMVGYHNEDLKLQSGDSFKYIQEVPDATPLESGAALNAFRLDDLDRFKGSGKIDCIKIDVEGAELLVLQGSIKTIRQYNPLIVLELSGDWTKRFKYKPYEVIIFLHDLGYEVEEYDFQQWIAKPIKANTN